MESKIHDLNKMIKQWPQATIRHTTIIEENCKIGNDVFIGHYCILRPYTIVGDRTKIGHLTVIEGWTTIGEDCFIATQCNITKGTFIGDQASTFWITPDSSTPGKIRNIAVTRTTRGIGVSGSGAIISINLKTLKRGKAAIRIKNLKLANAQAEEIPSTVQDGRIKVTRKK